MAVRTPTYIANSTTYRAFIEEFGGDEAAMFSSMPPEARCWFWDATTIGNVQHFKEFIHGCEFWQVNQDDIPEFACHFMMINEDNYEEVLTEFGNQNMFIEIYNDLKEQLSFAALNATSHSGCLPAMKFILNNYDFTGDTQRIEHIFYNLVENGFVECLQFMHLKIYNDKLCRIMQRIAIAKSIAHNKIKNLKFLHGERKYELWDTNLETAIETSLDTRECIDYLLDEGLTFNLRLAKYYPTIVSAEHNNLLVFKHMHEKHNVPVSALAIYEFAGNHNTDGMQYIYDLGIIQPGAQIETYFVEYNGSASMLKYMHEVFGMSVGVKHMTAAVTYGNLECAEYLHAKHGMLFDDNMREALTSSFSFQSNLK